MKSALTRARNATAGNFIACILSPAAHNIDGDSSRSPHARICRPKEGHHGCPHRRRQMSDARIIAHINPRATQELRQFIQVLDRFTGEIRRELLLWPMEPPDRHPFAQPSCNLPEITEWRPLRDVAR